MQKMKIGIVGCGLNSDYHINFAKSYHGAEVVGVVDRDESKSGECARRFGIKNTFTSIKDLVEKTNPDVVHILTPPKTHFNVAREALELKRHVLLEKPMALNLKEAEALFDLAETNGVKLCTMHNHLFDPCMEKADMLVKKREAGEVINVESYYGLNTNIPAFRSYPVPNVIPWLYELPGGVYQDFLPHPLYVLLEYTGRPREIKVMKSSHGVLPQKMPDEIRILVDGEKAFGTLTFSFAAKPHLHFIRIYGTKMMAEVDINTMTTVVHPVSSLPKAAQKATYNLSESWQLFRSTISNVKNFLTGKLRPYQGMKVLIHRYYDAIKNGTESPITRAQALMVIGAMDEIFRQLDVKPLVFENIIPERPPYAVRHKEKVLVTGGTGFLGKRLVEMLVNEGYPVRVLARKLSNIKPLKRLGVEVFYGDVADKVSLGEAFEGADVVVHAAAGTSGEKKDCDTATMQGTANVIELCEARKVERLVYLSSCSVYGVADYSKGQVISEIASLERFPERRGNYSASKQQAEALVSEAVKRGLPAVILRPGTIYGPGGDVYTPMMGFSVTNKLFVVIGNGSFELPFVYVDNLVDAVIKAIRNEKAAGQMYNVVDSERINKRQYMDKLIKKLYPASRKVYFPFSLFYLAVYFQELLCGAIKRGPFLTRYRVVSSQKNIRYDNSKLTTELGWTPKVSVDEAVEKILEYEGRKA